MNDELSSLLEKVRHMYMKYGVKSVTMDDVSRELGISKKTLYQYVKDKNELVEKVFEVEIEYHKCYFISILERSLNAIDELFEVLEHVNQMIKEHNPSQEYDLRKYYPDLHQRITRVRQERMYGYILANLKRGKDEGLYRDDLNDEILAKVHLLRIEKTFDNEIFTPDEITSPLLFHELFIYHIRGIANEKGLQVLNEKLSTFK